MTNSLRTMLDDEHMYYFWTGASISILAIDERAIPHEKKFPYKNFLCVDSDASVDYPHSRYGRYVTYGNQTSNDLHWEHVPFDEFPNEFRLALLLLGVP